MGEFPRPFARSQRCSLVCDHGNELSKRVCIECAHVRRLETLNLDLAIRKQICFPLLSGKKCFDHYYPRNHHSAYAEFIYQEVDFGLA